MLHSSSSRLLRVIAIALLVLPGLLLPATTGAQVDPAPNVVLVMVDDLDQASFDALVDLDLLPNIQRLMDEGASFEESFVSNAVCCPSRATLLSGQYTHNHGVYTNSESNGSVRAFEDDDTLATWLQAAGYRTGFIGKYLNGYGDSSNVFGRPFILSRVRAGWRRAFPDQAHRMEAVYRPPGWDEWRGLLGGSAYCTYNYLINADGDIIRYRKDGAVERVSLTANGVARGIPEVLTPPVGDGLLHNYQTDVLGEMAVDFIERTSGSAAPFFLAVTPLAPHVEACNGIDPDGPQFDGQVLFSATLRPAERHRWLSDAMAVEGPASPTAKPSFNEQDLSDKPFHMRWFPPLTQDDRASVLRQYGDRLASMLAVDDLVGQILTALESQSVLDDTYVVFTSDNGWFYGEHRRSGKGFAYEETIRVPLVIRVPGASAASVRQEMVLNNDLAPTIADLAGAVPGQDLDGRSLRPLLEGESPPWRRRILIEHYVPDIQDDWRFTGAYNLLAVRTASDAADGAQLFGSYHPGVQQREGYYLAQDRSPPVGGHVASTPAMTWELYDLEADPYQLDSRIDARQRLCDDRFDLPESPCWEAETLGDGAGHERVDWSYHVEAPGLYLYTAPGNATWSRMTQRVDAAEGELYAADTFARSARRWWPAGASAGVALEFLDVSGAVLARHQSGPEFNMTPQWRYLDAGVHRAPPATRHARVVLSVDKTAGLWSAGAVFDEAQLLQFDSTDPQGFDRALRLRERLAELVGCRGASCREAEDRP